MIAGINVDALVIVVAIALFLGACMCGSRK